MTANLATRLSLHSGLIRVFSPSLSQLYFLQSLLMPDHDHPWIGLHSLISM